MIMTASATHSAQISPASSNHRQTGPATRRIEVMRLGIVRTGPRAKLAAAGDAPRKTHITSHPAEATWPPTVRPADARLGPTSTGARRLLAKSVLITGASRGFGAFACQELAGRGWRVFATARQDADLQALAARGVTPVRLELADSASVAACLQTVLGETGGALDALVNNAATGALGPLPGDQAPDRADMVRDFQANVFGTVELSLAAARAMTEKGGGRIVFVSSVLGLRPAPGKAVYAASKAALNSFGDAFGIEFDPKIIRASTLILGPLSRDGRGLWVCSHASACRRLVHACEAVRPKGVYHVGLPAHLAGWMDRLLPLSWGRRLMHRAG